jgi:hypothetical protein
MIGATMPLDTINFVDLIALTRITPEATVERFGGLINSSFFDASNILGTLKQKGLVDFVTSVSSFPNQSALTVTDEGKKLLIEAQDKANAPFDVLDMAVLIQISNGKRNLIDLATGVNVTPKDLAIHLNKLALQQFISYELRNGNVGIALTEKGFLRVKEGMPRLDAQGNPLPMQAAAAASSMPNMVDPSLNPAVNANEVQKKREMTPDEVEAMVKSQKKMKGIALLAIIVVIVIILGYLFVAKLV